MPRKAARWPPSRSDLINIRLFQVLRERLGLIYGGWVSGILHKLPRHEVLHTPEMIEALTAADLQAAARRYFDTDNYVQVVFNPETPAENPAPK